MRCIQSVVITIFILGGCNKGQELRAKAAADFGCNEDQVETEEVRSYVEAAAGCGHSNVYLHDGKSWKSPVESASFDLSCPAKDLKTKDLGGGRVGVSGCGKKATYVVDTKPGFGTLVPTGWIVNSSSSGKGEAPNDGAASE